MTGEDLANARKRVKLTQSMLADALGISRRTLSDYENLPEVPQIVASAVKQRIGDLWFTDIPPVRKRNVSNPSLPTRPSKLRMRTTKSAEHVHYQGPDY